MGDVGTALFVLAIMALNAAIFVGLVFIGVRLAIRPATQNHGEWLRKVRIRFGQLKLTIARARHYQGD